eukprot:CAMPEP_0171242324 /NCGR_PEP_ID=MMETSP0790-20130122/45623_1 /TAXON_ID=2925 /ORGANISM="Alexandrium catenella, Strain OF101" /LENGTH=226 /DNA_ID=CAMNT_0011709103 /DNA_START=36 /DNA_END=717 /DNA_ORIENTATION=+
MSGPPSPVPRPYATGQPRGGWGPGGHSAAGLVGGLQLGTARQGCGPVLTCYEALQALCLTLLLCSRIQVGLLNAHLVVSRLRLASLAAIAHGGLITLRSDLDLEVSIVLLHAERPVVYAMLDARQRIQTLQEPESPEVLGKRRCTCAGRVSTSKVVMFTSMYAVCLRTSAPTNASQTKLKAHVTSTISGRNSGPADHSETCTNVLRAAPLVQEGTMASSTKSTAAE